MRQFPTFHIICAFIEGSDCTYDCYFRVFLLDGIEYHRKSFLENIGDKVFITDSEIFQIEGFRMSGFGTYFSPFCLFGVTVRPFYQVKNILNISTHLVHRDTALLTASQITVAGRVLTRYTGCKYRKRFSTNIFAELEIFVML